VSIVTTNSPAIGSNDREPKTCQLTVVFAKICFGASHSDKTAKGKMMKEEAFRYEGCTCPPNINIWGEDICLVCRGHRDDWAEAGTEAEAEACSVCDGLGHSAGEFGELCLANGRSWFEPSDPRDLYDGEDCF
jgi:hypothetical protein